VLTEVETRAWNDFNMFALINAWNAPWSPERHMSYPPGFREAISTLARCTHYVGIPNVLNTRIFEFLNREWWPDQRRQCFQYDCQLEQCMKYFQAKDIARPIQKAADSVTHCKCHVVAYCSKNCRDKDRKDGHQKICGRPPLRIPTKEDARIFDAVRAFASGNHFTSSDVGVSTETLESEVVDDGDDGDNGSWESVDSDDDGNVESEENNTRTHMIVQFFDRTCYRKIR
jgi:hypothetical protein